MFTITILINILLGIIAVLLFCLIVSLHEFGHFITAKACGIRVNEFAVGMGPTLFHFQKGETTYSLRTVERCVTMLRPLAISRLWRRMIVVAAGAVMNLLLGLVFMMIILVQQPVYTSTTISQFAEKFRFGIGRIAGRGPFCLH